MKKESKDMKREYAPYKEISGEVADRIRALRKEHGYKSQSSFADGLAVASPYEVVGFKPDNIKKRESHDVPYTIEELIEICELFNVDLDYLLGRQTEKRHEIKQLKELTGLSEEACEKIQFFANPGIKLSDYLVRERRRAIICLSWFIENSLLSVLSLLNGITERWWGEHGYAPKGNGESSLLERFADKAEDGGWFFETDEKEEAYFKERDEFRLCRAYLYDVKEDLANMVNMYFEEKRNTLEVTNEIWGLSEEDESEGNDEEV